MADDRPTETDVNRDDPMTNVTADREMVRQWLEESESTPAYRMGDADERELYVHHPDAPDEKVEETSWDEFLDRFEEGEMALVRHEDRTGPDQFELVHRTEAIERAALEDDEVERALMEGETVQTQITETKVVERTVQETETFESEVVGSETVRDEIIDTQLVRREITGVHFGEKETGVAIIEDSEATAWEEDVEEIDVTERETITVDIDETREVTRELVERRQVETRIVDRDVEETETVETDTLESRVDIEGVQRTILESDLLGGDVATEQVIEGGHVESEFTDDETILTNLYERRIVEDEVLDRKRLTFELTDEELLSSETVQSVLVETMLIGSDTLGEDTEIEGIAIERDETVVTDELTTGAETRTTTTETTTESGPTMGDVETTTDTDTTAGSEAIMLDDRDVGKDVVDANDEQVGVVTEVDEDNNMIYVDPHPGLAQRVKTRLGWEGHSEDAYTVESDRIERVGDDEIHLRSF